MKVIVKYGPDRHEMETINAPTIKQIKENDTLRAVLGFGDRVRALIDGVEQPDGLLLVDGTIVTLETACNTKAN